MKFECHALEAMYEHNDKRYIRVIVDHDVAQKIKHVQDKRGHAGYNPLDGHVLTVKVPYRYRRVMCTVGGTKPLQSVVGGDSMYMTVEYTGIWTKENYSGHGWKCTDVVNL